MDLTLFEALHHSLPLTLYDTSFFQWSTSFIQNENDFILFYLHNPRSNDKGGRLEHDLKSWSLPCVPNELPCLLFYFVIWCAGFSPLISFGIRFWWILWIGMFCRWQLNLYSSYSFGPIYVDICFSVLGWDCQQIFEDRLQSMVKSA